MKSDMSQNLFHRNLVHQSVNYIKYLKYLNKFIVKGVFL